MDAQNKALSGGQRMRAFYIRSLKSGCTPFIPPAFHRLEPNVWQQVLDYLDDGNSLEMTKQQDRWHLGAWWFWETVLLRKLGLLFSFWGRAHFIGKRALNVTNRWRHLDRHPDHHAREDTQGALLKKIDLQIYSTPWSKTCSHLTC